MDFHSILNKLRAIESNKIHEDAAHDIQCNETGKGEWCPVHGMEECSMPTYEDIVTVHTGGHSVEPGAQPVSECNMTQEGQWCPVHGMEECWSSPMMEDSDDTVDADTMDRIQAMVDKALASMDSQATDVAESNRAQNTRQLQKNLSMRDFIDTIAESQAQTQNEFGVDLNNLYAELQQSKAEESQKNIPEDADVFSEDDSDVTDAEVQQALAGAAPQSAGTAPTAPAAPTPTAPAAAAAPTPTTAPTPTAPAQPAAKTTVSKPTDSQDSSDDSQDSSDDSQDSSDDQDADSGDTGDSTPKKSTTVTLPPKRPAGSGTTSSTPTPPKPAPTQPKPAASSGQQSFKDAFKAARQAAGGAGGVFMWNGKPYQTNIKGEPAQAWNSPNLKQVGTGWDTAQGQAYTKAQQARKPKTAAPTAEARTRLMPSAERYITEAGMSFKQAFAAARKEAGGAGGVFMWNGKPYQTNIKGEAALPWNSDKLKRVGGDWETPAGQQYIAAQNKFAGKSGKSTAAAPAKPAEKTPASDEPPASVAQQPTPPDDPETSPTSQTKSTPEPSVSSQPTASDDDSSTEQEPSAPMATSQVESSDLVARIANSKLGNVPGMKEFATQANIEKYAAAIGLPVTDHWIGEQRLYSAQEISDMINKAFPAAGIDADKVKNAAAMLNIPLADAVSEDAPLGGFPFTPLGATNNGPEEWGLVVTGGTPVNYFEENNGKVTKHMKYDEIHEALTINTSRDVRDGKVTKTLNINATDEDAESLASLLRHAGLGMEVHAMHQPSGMRCDGCGLPAEQCHCADHEATMENADHDHGHDEKSGSGEPLEVDDYIYHGRHINQRFGKIGDNTLMNEQELAIYRSLLEEYDQYLIEADLPDSNAGFDSPLTANSRDEFDKDPFAGEEAVTDGSHSPLSTVKRQDVMN
jgi:hypothetical protein